MAGWVSGSWTTMPTAAVSVCGSTSMPACSLRLGRAPCLTTVIVTYGPTAVTASRLTSALTVAPGM